MLVLNTSVRFMTHYYEEDALTDDLDDAHTDTAQSYRNEAEAGRAFKESGLARSDVFITTKYSGLDGLDIPTSINNSLKNVSCFRHIPSFEFVLIYSSWESTM